ncbi:DUF5819 family protein [Microbacterium hydrothermale]|uniref:DUF5819 family protein n=1 Tax=Microbacterium hydrothermale TaxID=857427 RepID=UPI0010A8BEBF|nr:DUF5819 family protein [Microbacterium hydrothermale]
MTTKKTGAGRITRPAPAPRPAPSARGRLAPAIGTAAAVAVVGAYVFVSATFTAPPSPAKEMVSDGFAPYFSQRWDVFAPNILRVNSALQVQAQWRDEDGDLQASDWVDVTDMELAAVRGIPTPSRISKNSINALSTYLERYDELTSAQQDRVQDTFIERSSDGGFAAIPDADLRAELDALGDGGENSSVPFVRYDYMLNRFSTAFTEAYFGREVERVRWRAQFDRPNDFLHRFDDERQFALNELTFGWREAEQADDPSVRGIFADVQTRYTGEERP